MRSRFIPVIYSVILILCETESTTGLSFSFLFGGSFIGEQIVVHTPPERGFIDRDKSDIKIDHEDTPEGGTDYTYPGQH